MKLKSVYLPLVMIPLLYALAAQAEGYHVSGKIIRPDGTPLEATSVSFNLEVLSPNNSSCILFQEQVSVNMQNSKGQFNLNLGGGTRSYPSVGFSLEKVFSNSTALTCQDSSTYTPTSSDERNLRISFYDGAAWQSFAPQALKAVPFATESKNAQSSAAVGTYLPTSLLRVDGGTAPALTSAQATSLVTLAAGTSGLYLTAESDPSVSNFAKASLPTCSVGQVLKSDGVALSCVADGGSGFSLPTGSLGQVLRHDGSSWNSANLGISDIASLSTTLSDKLSKATLPSCAADQTMIYFSVTDTWACQNLSLSLGGDLYGDYSTATVAKIRGSTVSAANPLNGQVLKFDGSQWTPTTLSYPVVSVAGKIGAVTLDYGDVASATGKYLTYKPNNISCTDGQTLKWSTTNFRWDCGTDFSSAGTVTNISTLSPYMSIANSTTTPVISLNVGTVTNTLAAGDDARFTNARPPSGTAAGDLTGTYPTPTVAKILGKPVDVTAGYAEGDQLVYDAAGGKWILKKANSCPAGWTLVNRGVKFCLKKIDATVRNFFSGMETCSLNGGAVCSLNQIHNACKISAMALDEEAFYDDYTSYPMSAKCAASFPVINNWSGTPNQTLLTYCCQPAGN